MSELGTVPLAFSVTVSVQVSLAPLPCTVKLSGAVKNCKFEPLKV